MVVSTPASTPPSASSNNVVYYVYLTLAIEMLVLCREGSFGVEHVAAYLTKNKHVKSVTMMDHSSTELYVRIFKGIRAPDLERIQSDLKNIDGVINIRFIR